MAENKLIISLDLEQGDISKATASIEKSAGEIGKKAGKKFSDNFQGGLNPDLSQFVSKITKATSLIGGLVTAYAGFKAIDAASAQEEAINSMNSALMLSRNATLDASKGLQEYATELQNTTKFEDDAILTNAAFIQSLGDLSESGLKQAMKATTDLATALRIDLNSAAMLVGKAASGEVGTFSRYGIAIKQGATNAETFANAMTAIQSKFGGMAERDVNTYSGAITQLKNAFGDMLEPIGMAVTKNPQFIAVIKDITKVVNSLSANIGNFLANFDLFKFITTNLIPFNEALINFVVAPLELVVNVAKLMQESINLVFAKIISGLGNVGWAIAKVLDTLNIGEKLSQGLKDFEETSQQVADETGAAFTNALATISDFPFADMLATKNEELRSYFEELNTTATEQSVYTQANIQGTGSALMEWSDVFKQSYDELNNKLGMTQDNIMLTNDKMKQFVKESSVALRDGFARGAGQAFAAFGAAIAKGENALDSFTKVLFKTIADQAIALGTNFMLTGAAMMFSPNPADNAKAPFLIKSGAALAVFGGFLGATAGAGGGTGGSTAGNTGVGAGNVDMRNDVASPESINEERMKPQTNVSIQVNGSLVQQEELGEFITRTLNESFGKQGVTLTDARFA